MVSDENVVARDRTYFEIPLHQLVRPCFQNIFQLAASLFLQIVSGGPIA